MNYGDPSKWLIFRSELGHWWVCPPKNDDGIFPEALLCNSFQDAIDQFTLQSKADGIEDILKDHPWFQDRAAA